MKREERIPVEVKVRQAVALWREEHPDTQINISKICEMAGVNRSNLYRTHVTLLNELGLVRSPRRSPNPSQSRTEIALREELKRLQMENNLLRFLWVEEAGSPLKARHPRAVLQDVEAASLLNVTGGRFFRRAVLSYLGDGTVRLSEFDSLDSDRKKLFIEFLGLRVGTTMPPLEVYDDLRKRLCNSSDQNP
ncbi:hypothetical protein [Hylemonella gracilis]|uniref:hypothetical protein n=1 Tax=Hylemonella gracilis TaxID=80880 RepID=UPI0011107B63|nr:hypothetical protein [Hylemonella gracilis]